VPVSGSRLEIAGLNRPCEEAGGDYFDYIHLGRDRVAIVIGDVAGHGVGSALFMVAARSLLRTFLPRLDGIGAVLAEVNRALVRDMPPGAFMSLFLGDLDLSTGQLRYASAGHTAGLVYRGADGSFEELGPTGPALGIVDEASYEVCEVIPPLHGEDAVLLYTDGATEAMGTARELYGVERLKREFARVHHERAPRIVDHLVEEISRYAGGRIEDDISFLVVKATNT
jgi:sigma-B regulation protein RsbU (phosphoserine phosphatase)